MDDVFKLGPFLISYKLIIIVLSSIFGYFALVIALKKIEIDRRLILDILLSSILILILAWKFGGILFNPKQILSNPLLILFITGNTATLFLGFILSTGYIFLKLYKNGVPILLFLDLISFSSLPFLLIYNLFTPMYGYPTRLPWGISLGSDNVLYHPVNFYFAIFIILISVYILREFKTIGNGILFMKASLLLGISGLVLTFISPQSNMIMGISPKQWGFAFLMTVGLVGLKKENSTSPKAKID